jgi:hypothetical protein
MHISGVVAVLVVGSVLLAIVVSFLLPVAIVAAAVWLVVRLVEAMRDRRPSTNDLSAVRPDVTSRDIGWAAGLLVAGVLWFMSRHHFAALLLGLGTAYLTRALLEMRRRPGT